MSFVQKSVRFFGFTAHGNNKRHLWVSDCALTFRRQVVSTLLIVLQSHFFNRFQVKFEVDIVALELRDFNPEHKLFLLLNFGPELIFGFEGWAEGEPPFLLDRLGQFFIVPIRCEKMMQILADERKHFIVHETNRGRCALDIEQDAVTLNWNHDGFRFSESKI